MDVWKVIGLLGSMDIMKEIGLSGSRDFLKEIGLSSSMDIMKEIGPSGSRDFLKEIGLSSSMEFAGFQAAGTTWKRSGCPAAGITWKRGRTSPAADGTGLWGRQGQYEVSGGDTAVATSCFRQRKRLGLWWLFSAGTSAAWGHGTGGPWMVGWGYATGLAHLWEVAWGRAHWETPHCTTVRWGMQRYTLEEKDDLAGFYVVDECHATGPSWRAGGEPNVEHKWNLVQGSTQLWTWWCGGESRDTPGTDDSG